jgi:hypothetical protein
VVLDTARVFLVVGSVPAPMREPKEEREKPLVWVRGRKRKRRSNRK